MTILTIALISYLLGSIPFGVVLARLRKTNIREHGSGNIGATNVARVLGKKLGALTLFGDALKGVAAVGLAALVLGEPVGIALAGLMAFLGHLYSVFLKFKGGKGVATGLGIFLFMTPLAALSAMGVFAVALWTTGYVSAASMLASLFLPLFALFYKMPLPYIYAAVIVGLLVIHKHYDNIQRIIAGTEARFLEK